MKPFFSHWTEIYRRLTNAPRWLVALDYDGVLTPLRSDATRANLSRPIKHLLHRLNHHPKIQIAIVSGRGLADLRRKVSPHGLILAGNHGLDIQFPGKRERRGDANMYRRALKTAQRKLAALLHSFPGSRIEDKRLGFSLHYRGIPARRRANLQRQFRLWQRGLPRTLRVTAQKMAFDFVPHVNWDKGDAVLRIWRHVGRDALPIYLGDDQTDENAFRALRKRGVTIFVGPRRPTLADYHLRSPREVQRFLRRLIQTS